MTPASLSAANGLFGAVREIGQLIGPAVAAALLLVAEPELVLALNAVTFAASAAADDPHARPPADGHAGRRGRRPSGPDQRSSACCANRSCARWC